MFGELATVSIFKIINKSLFLPDIFPNNCTIQQQKNHGISTEGSIHL